MVRRIMNKKTKRPITRSEELPLDCVSKILSFVSPLTPFDLCMFSMVSTVFRTVAASESMWEKLLPHDYEYFISKSVTDFPETLRKMSKKSLVVHFIVSGIMIDKWRMIVSLDKHTGKKCFLLRGDKFCKKNSVYLKDFENAAIPSFSRFYDFARFKLLSGSRFTTRMEPSFLAPQTRYGVFLIFKLASTSRSRVTILQKLRVSFKSANDLSHRVDREPRADVLYLKPRHNYPVKPQDLAKEVKEYEIGRFFNVNGKRISSITCLVDEYIQTIDGPSGIILIGIEVRPIVD